MFCQKCGANLGEVPGDTCPYCGNPVEAASEKWQSGGGDTQPAQPQGQSGETTILTGQPYNQQAPQNGYQQNGYQQNGYQQNGYQQNGYQQNGYQQNGYQQNGYQQNGYQQNGYQQNGVPAERIPAEWVSTECPAQSGRAESLSVSCQSGQPGRGKQHDAYGMVQVYYLCTAVCNRGGQFDKCRAEFYGLVAGQLG